MKEETILRIVLDLLVAASIVFGWWFVALPLAVFGAWQFPYYLEILAAGLAYDGLYGLGDMLGLWGMAGAIAGAILLAVVAALKLIIRR